MAPSKRIQLVLIGSMGALFFLAAVAADRRISPLVLGGACVVVLAVILLVVRRAGGQSAAPVIARPGSRRGTRLRTLAVLAGIGLLEVTQIPTAPLWVKGASVAAAIGLVIGAVVTSRRRRS